VNNKAIHLELGLGSDGTFLGSDFEDMYCLCNGGAGAMLRFPGGGITRLLCGPAGVLAEPIHLPDGL